MRPHMCLENTPTIMYMRVSAVILWRLMTHVEEKDCTESIVLVLLRNGILQEIELSRLSDQTTRLLLEALMLSYQEM